MFFSTLESTRIHRRLGCFIVLRLIPSAFAPFARGLRPGYKARKYTYNFSKNQANALFSAFLGPGPGIRTMLARMRC